MRPGALRCIACCAALLAASRLAAGEQEQLPKWSPEDRVYPLQLAEKTSELKAEPAGLSLDLGRGRKLTFPYQRHVPASHVTLESVVAAAGSTLTYRVAWKQGCRLYANALLAPVGKAEDIKAGLVRFSAEVQDADGKVLDRASAELKTAKGKIERELWTPLALLNPEIHADAAQVVLRTEALDDAGKPLAPTAEQVAPLGVFAVWGDPRIERPTRGNPQPAVLLIAYDTLRAGRLGAYGYKRGDKSITPVMDALAARGYLFERCYSPTSWTLPAFQAALSGLHPAQLGYGQAGARDPNEEMWAKVRYGRASNLPQILGREKNAYAFAATGGGMLEPFQNFFLKGFSYYWSNPNLDPLQVPPNETPEQERARLSAWLGMLSPPETKSMVRTEADVNAQHAIACLGASGACLGFFHTYQCHTPYTETRFVTIKADTKVPVPFGEGTYLAGGEKALYADFNQEQRAFIQALYDGDVAGADDNLDLLLGRIEASGLSERAWIILFSDHGEEFWEHGGLSHGHSLYDELLHVPLIVVPPGGLKEGVRIAEPVSLLDILPTVCEIAGAETPANLLGRSLKPLLTEDANARKKAALPDHPGLFAACGTYHGPMRWALRHGKYKYILTIGANAWAKDEANRKALRLVPEELFDLEADPGEQTNLATDGAHEKTRAKLADLLKVLREGPLAPIDHTKNPKGLDIPPLSPELLRKLKQLGY